MSEQRPDVPRIELKELTKEYWQGFQDGQLSMQKNLKIKTQMEKEREDADASEHKRRQT